MYVQINDIDRNIYMIASVVKNGKEITYKMINGVQLKEVFDSDSDAEAKYEDVIAMSGGGGGGGNIPLDPDGKIPAEYLPSYVDDVIDLLAVTDTAPSTCAKGDKYYDTVSKKIFTATATNTWGSTGKTPEKDKIYVNTADDPASSWRWSGTDLVMIGGGAVSTPTFKPFPNSFPTTGTTQAFLTTVSGLGLEAGDVYLGEVTFSDLPFSGNAEIEVYIYPDDVVYCMLRSANVAPYLWTCNSHTFRGWEEIGPEEVHILNVASGGSMPSVYLTLAGLKKGVYTTSYGVPLLYLRYKETDTYTTALQLFEPSFVILKDITADETNGTPVVCLQRYTGTIIMLETYAINSTKSSGIEPTSQGSATVMSATSQTFSGKKTFNTLPESSGTPTTDYQLTNKKYVDSKDSFFILTATDYPGGEIHLKGLKKGTYMLKDFDAVKFNWDANSSSYMEAAYPYQRIFYVCRDLDDNVADHDEILRISEVRGYTRKDIVFYRRTSLNSGIGGQSATALFVNTDLAQSITAKKTFTVLPESSVVPTTNNQLVNKKYVDDTLVNIQYSAIPTADSTMEGDIIQYVGATGNGYTKGYFYVCESDGGDPATYSWTQINVQPQGSSPSPELPENGTRLLRKAANSVEALGQISDPQVQDACLVLTDEVIEGVTYKKSDLYVYDGSEWVYQDRNLSANADWEESTAGSPNYIKGRTHYKDTILVMDHEHEADDDTGTDFPETFYVDYQEIQGRPTSIECFGWNIFYDDQEPSGGETGIRIVELLNNLNEYNEGDSFVAKLAITDPATDKIVEVEETLKLHKHVIDVSEEGYEAHGSIAELYADYFFMPKNEDPETGKLIIEGPGLYIGAYYSEEMFEGDEAPFINSYSMTGLYNQYMTDLDDEEFAGDDSTYFQYRYKVNRVDLHKLNKEYIPQLADWNVNDETDPSYVANRTHYKIEDSQESIAIFDLDDPDYSQVSEEVTTGTSTPYLAYSTSTPAATAGDPMYDNLETVCNELETLYNLGVRKINVKLNDEDQYGFACNLIRERTYENRIEVIKYALTLDSDEVISDAIDTFETGYDSGGVLLIITRTYYEMV